MKKILIAALILSVSPLINAKKEVKAKVYYDADNNRVLSAITDTKNEKCIEYIRSEEGLKILKILSKNNKGRVLLYFICNQETTERR